MKYDAVNTFKLQEELMLSRLLQDAKDFYAIPKNREAYEAWKKRKEGKDTTSEK